jgi:hypothetical protein
MPLTYGLPQACILLASPLNRIKFIVRLSRRLKKIGGLRQAPYVSGNFSRAQISKMNLDNIKMNVIKTAPNGVVNDLTIFTFSQTDNVVSATYCGGEILKGYLVGTVDKDKLFFCYCQLQTNGKIDNGQSECDIVIDESQKIKLIERFEWRSREGKNGVNIFQEL